MVHIVGVFDQEIYDITSLDASRYKLHLVVSIIYTDALLNKAHIERHLFDAVEVLVKYEQLKVLGACKVQVILQTVAYAADLAT